MTSAAYFKIHPGIGIARVGNAPPQSGPAAQRDDFFVGPVRPGTVQPPPGGYKLDGRTKRQAAQFRVFAYAADGTCLGEVTAEDAKITWTVELANTKASWLQFNGQQPGGQRNPLAQGADRARLNITPGPRRVSGVNAPPEYFDSGTFTAFSDTGQETVPVPLGEILTDAAGHLLVLGGAGLSGSPINAPITSYANNDGWFDDSSDGSVKATIVLIGSDQAIEATPSWVICNVPKFAPELQNFVTGYDLLTDLWAQSHPQDQPQTTDFWTDIYPILMRIMNVRWTMGTGPVHAFAVQMALNPAQKPETALANRKTLFDRIRSPLGNNRGLMNMPMIYSDEYVWQPQGNAGFALTRTMYAHLARWQDDLTIFADPATKPVADPDAPVTAQGMDQAALENTCGGPFFPGMEFSWMMRDVYSYCEATRLDPLQRGSVSGRMEPGDVTKQMALPWQADFLQCRRNTVLETPNGLKPPPSTTTPGQSFGPVYYPGWWPQQRPDMVTQLGQAVPQVWTRGIGVDDSQGLVENWSKLGFVTGQTGGYYETDRNLSHQDTDAP